MITGSDQICQTWIIRLYACRQSRCKARIMSNVIPIVSSSPPPLDDDADFKWDDDDDEYGNFTSAPSVSTTTITNDSSFEVNWSNSETSLPATDGSSKGSPIKSDSRTHLEGADLNSPDSDRKSSENILSNNQDSQTASTIRAHDTDAEVTASNEDFQDCVHFGTTEVSKSSLDASCGVTENEQGPYQDLSLSLKQSGDDGSVADAPEEDDFQEFAHFNDTVVSESWQHSALAKPELSQGENKTHSNNILTISSHSNKEGQGLMSDQCSEAVVTDSDSTSSVHLKNSDSIYSSASTVDSGMFSADLSPSSHQGEVTDICLNVNKEVIVGHNNDIIQQANIPTSSSVSAGRSLVDEESLETSEEHADVTFDNTISDEVTVATESSIDHCKDSMLSVSGRHSSQNHRSDLSSSDIAEGWVDPTEEANQLEKLSDIGEPQAGGDKYQHSTLVQRSIDVSSRTSSPTHDRSPVHTENSVASPKPSNEVEQALENQSSLPASGCDIAIDHDVESVKEGVSSETVKNHPEDELRATKNNSDTTVICEDGEECNIERSIQSEVGGIVGSAGSEDACCDIASEVGDRTEVHVQDLSKAVSFKPEETNGESSLQTTGFAPGTGLSDCSEPLGNNDNIAEEVVEDMEFGEFSFNKGQAEDDSHEIPPITFRTSICEASEADDDEFTFVRERPPALGDEGGNGSDEFGAVTKDVSDADDDDFGEFDSAANFQPKSSASGLNNRDEDEDDFGDFGKSEPGGGDAGWADFGSAPSLSEGSDNSFTKTQATVSVNLKQSKAQTLREAVMSCFLESSDQSHKGRVMVDGSEQGTQNSNNSMNPSKEDEGPLPLDTVVDLGLSNALEAKQQTWAVVQHPAKKDPKVRLWANLKDVDSCHALMYGWHASHCSKEVYATLHIDTQNILFTQKKQAVPFFASGLGILEPIRGGGGGTLERKKEKSNIPVTPNTLLDISKTDNHQNSTPQDIPPVDFDWGSSGLTNPLTVFKTDNQESSQSTLQPLEEILKKTTPTAKLATNEVLSPEAARVLEKMPDLSFMLSRVLMFPVKQ